MCNCVQQFGLFDAETFHELDTLKQQGHGGLKFPGRFTLTTRNTDH